jgi:TatA/E family protein of Tat protein translocase
MGAMVGPGELVLILIVVLFILLIWRGPQVLPKLGEAMGKTIKGFRDELPDEMKGDKADSTDKLDADGSAGSADSGDKPSA